MTTDQFVTTLFNRHHSVFSDRPVWEGVPDIDFQPWLGDVEPKDIAPLFDELGACLALRYHSNEFPYWFCDWIVNDAYVQLMRTYQNAPQYPALFDRVYQAFDDGEWDHGGRSIEPIREFTDPAIDKIVTEIQSKMRS